MVDGRFIPKPGMVYGFKRGFRGTIDTPFPVKKKKKKKVNSINPVCI